MFFAALFATISAIFLFERVARYSYEIAVGCIAIALIGTVITLISAPWQILVILLTAALASYRLIKTELLS